MRGADAHAVIVDSADGLQFEPFNAAGSIIVSIIIQFSSAII